MRYFLVHVVERIVQSDGYRGGFVAASPAIAKTVCEIRYKLRGSERVIVSEVYSPEAKSTALQGHQFYLAEKAEFDAIMRNLR